MTLLRTLSVFVATAAVASCRAHSPGPEVLQAPERPSSYRAVAPSRSTSFMVATANPEATQAGVRIIEAGGTALDAAVAVQMVLTVTEPQSSGIGGGLFLLYFDAKTQTLTGYDGREKAPAALTPTAFLQDDGTPRPFLGAAVGGLSVGVPGTLAALKRAHAEHGALPWPKLFDPAISLARTGWTVHPRLANALKTVPHLAKYAKKGSTFFDDAGRPRSVGQQVTNPQLAGTFKQIATQGIDVFYRGSVGAEIVRVVQEADNPGRLTLEDLAAYEPEVRPAHCEPYRAYRICGFPPPAGSLVAITLLKLLERFDLSSMEPSSAEFFHV